MKATLAALLLAAGLAAQEPGVDLRLAADPDGSGPAAWVWLRQNLAARIPGWPAEVDPGGALRAQIGFDGSWSVDVDAEPIDDDYLRFDLRSISGLRGDSELLVSGSCKPGGHARWVVHATDAELPDEVMTLLRRFGLEARSGGLSLDLASITGNLMAGAPPGDLCGEALTVAAMDCGEVALLAWPHPSRAMTWIVHGQSDGGLLLPALLITLADRQARRAPDQSDQLERWLLLAATAEGEERVEALRQLARFDDPRALEALEAARHSEMSPQWATAPGLSHQDSQVTDDPKPAQHLSRRKLMLIVATASALLFAAMLVVGRQRGAIA